MDYSRINHETVAWATENARELLKDENERIQALDAKAAQLAGFSGVILAVLGSITPDAFDGDLGALGDPLFAATYFASVGALTAAILWLVFLSLRPQRFIAIDAEELTAYLEDEDFCGRSRGRYRSEPFGRSELHLVGSAGR